MSTTLTREEIREAMALPGWRLCEGLPMVTGDGHRHFYDPGQPPEAWEGTFRCPAWSHPMVAGWLLSLLGDEACLVSYSIDENGNWRWWDGADWYDAPELGTACVRVALSCGGWPGGVTP